MAATRSSLAGPIPRRETVLAAASAFAFRLLRRLGWALLILIGIYLLVYLAHRPFRGAAPTPLARFELLAHRGVHQNYSREDLDAFTCTAQRIHPPTHDLLENTLDSIQAALDAGADRIEIDLHLSRDGVLMVFHDWTVDCRTDGQGETRSLTLAELKALDIGHGYTADGGRTFPFRGRFIGAMPTLSEVLTRFPHAHFLLDQKDRSPATTAALITLIAGHPDVLSRVCLQAIAPRNAQFLQAVPAGCAWPGRPELAACWIAYLRAPWRSALPEACAGRTLIVPDWAASRLLWGWPGTFVERVHASGSRVLVLTDDPARAEHFRQLGFDGIWTDHIERFGHPRLPPIRQ